ncbi:MAG: DMT family transporter [Humidesulfovibrio sp.]|nr:DMT family transporter [Humidesulfovibrio sp.]
MSPSHPQGQPGVGGQAGLAVYVKLTGCMALWGATWVSGRYVALEMGPFPAAFLRFLSASVFLYLLSCRAGHGWPRPPHGAWGGVAFLGLTGVFLYNSMFFSGLALIPAARAAMIVACVPSAVALYSALVLRAPTTALKALGIALSLSGVAVILSGGDPRLLFTHGPSKGDLLILGCVVAWAAYSIGGGRVVQKIPPLSAVTWSCVLGNAMLLPPALATGLVPQALAASGIVWANLLFLGVGATGLAFLWYHDGIRALGAQRASIFINLVPVFATLLSTMILGESVGLALVVGGAMVLAGVVLANRPA